MGIFYNFFNSSISELSTEGRDKFAQLLVANYKLYGDEQYIQELVELMARDPTVKIKDVMRLCEDCSGEIDEMLK